MQRSAIFLGQPITGIQGEELDHGSFGQIGRLVNDKPPGLHASLKRHATTVASAPPRKTAKRVFRGFYLPVSAVSGFLGHANSTTAARYLNMKDDLRESLRTILSAGGTKKTTCGVSNREFPSWNGDAEGSEVPHA